MAQRKETKTKIKVRDLKPKRDAKGGFVVLGQTHNQQTSGHQVSRGNKQAGADRFI
jgi:hypothetical protein